MAKPDGGADIRMSDVKDCQVIGDLLARLLAREFPGVETAFICIGTEESVPEETAQAMEEITQGAPAPAPPGFDTFTPAQAGSGPWPKTERRGGNPRLFELKTPGNMPGALPMQVARRRSGCTSAEPYPPMDNKVILHQ